MANFRTIRVIKYNPMWAMSHCLRGSCGRVVSQLKSIISYNAARNIFSYCSFTLDHWTYYWKVFRIDWLARTGGAQFAQFQSNSVSFRLPVWTKLTKEMIFFSNQNDFSLRELVWRSLYCIYFSQTPAVWLWQEFLKRGLSKSMTSQSVLHLKFRLIRM